MPIPAIGEPAPPFTATAHTGQSVSLADYEGKQVVVLYFYPRDGTSVCTTEACAFRDAYAEFTAAGAAVIGVSDNSIEQHRRFVDQRQLPFLLVSDDAGALRKAYGVPKLLGFLPGRTTFVIDKAGIVRLRFHVTLFRQPAYRRGPPRRPRIGGYMSWAGRNKLGQFRQGVDNILPEPTCRATTTKLVPACHLPFYCTGSLPI